MKASMAGRVGAIVLIGIVFVFLAAPIIVVVVFAFDSSARLALPYSGTSFRWFRAAFGNPMIADALGQSIKVGVAVGVLCMALGYAGARLMLSTSRATRILVGAGSAPSVFPALLIALSFAITLRTLGLRQGTMATILGQTLVALPFATVVLVGRLRGLDPSFAEASRDLGASAWRTFRLVTFPLIRGAVIAAGCLAMAISLDEFVIAFFTSGSSPTMPVVLWGLLRSTIDPTSNAVATVILGICSTLVITAIVQMGRDIDRV